MFPPEDVSDGVISGCSCSKLVQAIDNCGLKGMPTDEVNVAMSFCKGEATHTVKILPLPQRLERG